MPAKIHVVTLVIEYEDPMEKEDTIALMRELIDTDTVLQFPDPDDLDDLKEIVIESLSIRSVDEQ